MSPLTVQSICEKARELPCSPSNLPQVVELLSKEDAGIADLEEVILRDQALGAAVLKMANSVFFSGGRSFDSLAEAILRLGFRQTYRITVSVSGGRWSSTDIAAYGWQEGDFCRHSFAVAVASRKLADTTGLTDPDLAYTAGLMHDTGKLALAFAAGDRLDAVREYQKQESCDWMRAERKVLGFTHADVTAQLLSGWNFPEVLVQAGKHYAEPSKSPETFKPLVCIVHAAKHLATETGVGAGEDAFWIPLDQQSVEILRLEEADLQAMLPELVEVLEKLLSKEMYVGAIRFD